MKHSYSLSILSLLLIIPMISLADQAPDIELRTETHGTPSATDCTGKKRCVVVYIAPWCPACKASLPLIQQMRQDLRSARDAGFMIVIGHDRAHALNRMAEEIGGTVHLDYNDHFSNAIGGGGVPQWWVWDQNRKILMTFSGAPSGATPEKLSQYMIHRHLKLGEYI